MSESIFTLYSDEKFAKILFFLDERGFTNLESLKLFDFDELLFVPGVTEELAIEADQLFLHHSISSVDLQKTFDYPNNIYDTNSSTYKDENQDKQTSKSEHESISYDHSNTVQTELNVIDCIADSKSTINQHVESSLNSSTCLEKIDITEPNNLRRIYTDSINNPLSKNNNPLNEQNQCYPKSIDHLQLSVRARNCLRNTGICSLEDLLSWNEADLMRIKNMGVKTCNEILVFRDSIHLPTTNQSKLYNLENIDFENRVIPISLLYNIGMPEQGINLFLSNKYHTVGDLCNRSLNLQEYSYAFLINSRLSVPITQQFNDSVGKLKDNVKICMSKRCSGATLEEIGKELQLTRERVRQILVKACRNLVGIAELVASIAFTSDKPSFSFSDLINLFHSKESALFCKLVLQESKYVYYVKFSDSFIKVAVCGNDIEERLRKYTVEIIGEGLNFYDNLEFIESELQKNNLHFFDFVDIMNFLIYSGYRFYGDYVSKNSQSFNKICYDAILKFFEFDIKLDSDENNEDIKTLRQIIIKHYPGIKLPSNNRALTAAITRVSSKFILSSRGRYCPIEKIIYSIPLFEEIYSYIIDSSQASFYYSEIFSLFQGRLMAETSIDNSHFLHGMMKFLYPNDFVYERDLMSKIGVLRQNVDYRINQLLINNGHAMTKKEIQRSIPGINDFVISFSVMRSNEIIQWDYNEFNHIGNIDITQEEKTKLHNAIILQTRLHNGYTSETLLYIEVKDTCKAFLLKNRIVNPQNLYYVVTYLFREKYRFRRPHIISKDFPIQDISTMNILQVLLNCKTDISYEKYCQLATDLGWVTSTANAIFSELEKDFIRISENDYVHKNYFEVSESLQGSISRLLETFVKRSGYFAFNSIFDYEKFPESIYKWNSFLLESIINEYNLGFRVISPQMKDRRYQKGIIVSNNSPFETYEDLVIYSLKANNNSNLTENELLNYLRMHGLNNSNSIPQELYRCLKMPFKNEIFTLIN